jgi:hypothetical protein
MNPFVQRFALALLIVLPLAGCTTSSSVSLGHHRVGPAPAVHASATGEGLLLISPDWLPLTSLDDPDMSIRAVCRVLTEDGALYRTVRVWGAEHDLDPAILRLPAGLYTVEARASGYGRVGIPVVIEKNRMTVIRLDGELDPSFEAASASEFVALPNGSIIGWREKVERLEAGNERF